MNRETFLPLIEAGCSQRQIARTLGISQTTVRYWLGRHALKTKTQAHHRGSARYVERICRTHGKTTFIFEPSKRGYRCKRCRSGRVSEERRRLKQELVEHLGGVCIRCGYSKSIRAMHFHHREPTKKSHEMGFLIRDRKRQLAFEEVQKCDLVCANCHAEIEENIGV